MIFQDPVVTGSRRIRGSPGVSARLGVVQIDLSKAFNAWCRPRGIAHLRAIRERKLTDIYHQILQAVFAYLLTFRIFSHLYREEMIELCCFLCLLWNDLQHLGTSKEKVRSRNWLSGTSLEDSSKSYGIHAQRYMKSRIGMSSWQAYTFAFNRSYRVWMVFWLLLSVTGQEVKPTINRVAACSRDDWINSARKRSPLGLFILILCRGFQGDVKCYFTWTS